MAAAADVTLLDDMAVLLAFLQMASDRKTKRGSGKTRKKATSFFLFLFLVKANYLQIAKYSYG